jgi:hypothetical protein
MLISTIKLKNDGYVRLYVHRHFSTLAPYKIGNKPVEENNTHKKNMVFAFSPSPSDLDPTTTPPLHRHRRWRLPHLASVAAPRPIHLENPTESRDSPAALRSRGSLPVPYIRAGLVLWPRMELVLDCWCWCWVEGAKEVAGVGHACVGKWRLDCSRVCRIWESA